MQHRLVMIFCDCFIIVNKRTHPNVILVAISLGKCVLADFAIDFLHLFWTCASSCSRKLSYFLDNIPRTLLLTFSHSVPVCLRQHAAFDQISLIFALNTFEPRLLQSSRKRVSSYTWTDMCLEWGVCDVKWNFLWCLLLLRWFPICGYMIFITVVLTLHCGCLQSNSEGCWCSCQLATVAESSADPGGAADETWRPDILQEDCTASCQHGRIWGIQLFIYFGNWTSPLDNLNDLWKCLLVSWATALCVWTLRAPTRNLTYFTYLHVVNI